MKKKIDNSWKKHVVATYLLVALLLAMMMSALFSCAVQKPNTEKETVIEYRDRVVRDTATVEIPIEIEKIVTRDTSSHLENSYAKSDAVVKDGFLSHSLESKPKVIKVPVEVHVTDTLWKESEVIEKEVPVEKELTWWQKFRQNAFWWLLGAVALLLVWTFRKLIFKVL